MKAMRMPELFARAVDLAVAHGAKSIKDLPGCFELQIDDDLTMSVNGHGTPTKCVHGAMIPPYAVYLQQRGWPAAIVDPGGGTCAANEDELIAKIKEALAKVHP